MEEKVFHSIYPLEMKFKTKERKIILFYIFKFSKCLVFRAIFIPLPSLSLSFPYSASNYLKEKKILISRQSLEEWKISGGRNFRLEHAKCIEPFTQNVFRPKFSFPFLFIFIFSNVCCRAAAKSNKKHRKKNWEEGSIEFY